MTEITIYTFEAIIKTYYDVKETIELHSKENKTLQELSKEITTLIITIEKLRQIPPDVKIQTHCNDLQSLINEIHKWIIEIISNKSVSKINIFSRYFTTKENNKKVKEYIDRINQINNKIEKYLNIGNHLLSHQLTIQMESLIEAVKSNPDYDKIMEIIQKQKELFETKMKDYTDALIRSEQFYKSSIKDFNNQQETLKQEINMLDNKLERETNKLEREMNKLKEDNLEIKTQLLELKQENIDVKSRLFELEKTKSVDDSTRLMLKQKDENIKFEQLKEIVNETREELKLFKSEGVRSLLMENISVVKITELEKQIETLKNKNVELETKINQEQKRITNYFKHHLHMSFEAQRRLYTNGPF